MDDDDRPRPSGAPGKLGAASLLAGESLDSYSLDELDARIALLEDEIARVADHRARAAAHKLAAETLFKPRSA